jgi:putative NIF3 family GTP cyclohydrolase 1 type 2
MNETLTIQNVIDTILAEIPGGPIQDTVDTVKIGDPDQPVAGIVTTFLASMAVIRRAAGLGANFIITHEPTFYNHLDEVSELQDDPVYEAKRALLEDNEIVVWRFHDHWHRHEPDGIQTGVAQTLGWADYTDGGDRPLYVLPETTVGVLARSIKASLGIEAVRVVGDLTMPCSRVALMPGAPPARWQMMALAWDEVDVLVTGEVAEWETSEYARDAGLQGREKALIVLGHAKSEEPGMAYLVPWLQARVEGVEITHVPVGDAFQTV